MAQPPAPIAKPMTSAKNRGDRQAINNDLAKPEDISFVMIDGNNLGGGGGHDLMGSSRMSRRLSIASGGEYAGAPLPARLKQHHELLMLIMGGETLAAINLLKAMGVREVVGIRGLNLQIDDIEDT